MPKTILITGSSSGIGKATAELFANRGWNVAATMRSPNKSLFSSYKTIKIFELDVTKPETINSAIEQALNDFGKIDAVVNNAGYAAGGVFESIDEETIQKQFDVNLFGVMRVTKAVIPIFRQQNSGTIIQISSMAGRVSFPLCSLYNGTKWAVEGFSESLYHELAPFGIKLRLIEPGFIKTDFYDRSLVTIEKDGFEMYDRFAKKAEDARNQGRRGAYPEKVAKTIFKAVNSRSAKMRFPVGSPSPLLLFLRKLLPDSWFLKFMNKAI